MFKKIFILSGIFLSFYDSLLAVPNLSAPSQGQYLQTSKPAFQWTSDAGATSYDFCISPSADFSGASTTTVTSVTYVPADAISDGRYFWRVRSFNGVYSAWSTTGEFVVDTTSPSFSAFLLLPSAFSPSGSSPSTSTHATYLLQEASSITVTVSGPSPSASVVRTITDEIVLADNFNDADYAGWSVVAFDTWSVKNDSERANVLAAVEDSVSIDSKGKIVTGNVVWTDYAVEADVKLVNGNKAGLLFRIKEIVSDPDSPNDYYEFILNYDADSVQLLRKGEATLTTVGSGTMPPGKTLAKNKWFTLKVSVTGSTIRCYVDGSLRIGPYEGNIASGKVGLIGLTSSVSASDAAYFDNFRVYKLGQVWDGKKDDASAVDEGVYNIAVSARDLAGNTTQTFGIVHVDTTAPAAITDLALSLDGVSSGEVKLAWTTPYDSFGISNYTVKYATFQITSSNWNSTNVSTFTQAWTPSGTGSVENRIVNGLNNATTYYFAVKCLDPAQNASAVSNGPVLLTNAMPSVTVTRPNNTINIGGGVDPAAATLYCVNWLYSDQNPGDAQTFEIRLSTNSGVTYSILVASGIPNGTTFYQMETLNYEDCDPYRAPDPYYYFLKVTAVDSHSGSGYGTSTGFAIFNYDFAPVVTIVAPNGSEYWKDERIITWSIQDKNAWEIPNITYDIRLSTAGLVSVNPWSESWRTVVQGIKGTSYQFNTNERNQDSSSKYPNSRSCAVLIVAHGVPSDWRNDNFGGEAGGTDVSNSTFTINNTNRPPNAFSLSAPSKGSSLNSLRPVFSWSAATDPDTNDAINYYGLWYSTAADFSVKTAVSSITSNSWTATSDLQDGKRYYWRAQAFDKFGANTWSTETDWYFDINRSVKTSDDGKVSVRLNSSLPSSDAYVSVTAVTVTQSPALSSAKQKLRENTSVRSITDTAYDIKILQNGSTINTSINATISIDCPYGIDSNGYIDYLGIPARYLKIVQLDETENKWVIAAQDQTVDLNTAVRKATVSANVSHFSTYGIIAYAVPDSKLFSVGNYPNPFNPNNETTTITYGLLVPSKVTIEIFNLVGDLVYEKTVASPSYDSTGMTKNYEIWNGTNGDGIKVATGMYLCRLTAEPSDGSPKIVQIRKIGVKNK